MPKKYAKEPIALTREEEKAAENRAKRSRKNKNLQSYLGAFSGGATSGLAAGGIPGAIGGGIIGISREKFNELACDPNFIKETMLREKKNGTNGKSGIRK